MGSIKGVRRGKYKTYTLNNQKVYCWKCLKSYKRKAILEHHIRTKHLNHCVACPVCDQRFASVSTCHRHLREMHHISNYKAFNLRLKIYPSTKTPTTETPLTLLDFVADESFPCMANILSMKEDEEFGKHIVADCAIDLGKVVLATLPFASIEYLTSTGAGCFICGKSLNCNFIECPHCVNVHFCSKRCSMSEIHKSKCNHIFKKSDCHIVRLAFAMISVALDSVSNIETMLDFCRGILFFENKTKKCCRPPFSQYKEIIRLKGKSEEEHFSIAKRVCKYVMMSPKFRSHRPADFERIIYHLAVRHAACIQLNSFSEKFDVSEGGICTRLYIYDIFSRINHSCAANLHHYIDDNGIMSCIVIRPIKKGDQLFINYLTGSEQNTTAKRKSHIKQDWNFDCRCEKCSIDTLVGNNTDPSYQFIKRNFMKRQPDKVNLLRQKCIEYIQHFGHSWSTSLDFVVGCLISIINECQI